MRPILQTSGSLAELLTLSLPVLVWLSGFPLDTRVSPHWGFQHALSRALKVLPQSSLFQRFVFPSAQGLRIRKNRA